MTCRPAFVRSRQRLGFTLIELLVVIIIIGLLVALLVPAIAAAVRAARNASVQAEINQLAQALADFKSKMGDYPPSRIVINESGNIGSIVGTTNGVVSGASADIPGTLLVSRSLTAFRKFWPRVTFPPSFIVSQATGWYDFNGDGVYAGNQDYILQGNECLVFFLGGIPIPDTSTTPPTIKGMAGFGKSPTNPFSNNFKTTPANAMYSENRNPPFFEFNAGRLLVVAYKPPPPISTSTILPSTIPTASTALYQHNMPSYFDPLGGPVQAGFGGGGQPNNLYAYFSTYGGAGYDANDVNFGTDYDSNATQGLSLAVVPNQLVYLPMTTTSATFTQSPSPNPYTTSPPYQAVANGPVVTQVTYTNPQSFQIISSGLDGVYGLGGLYQPNSPSPTSSALPFETANTTDRTIERDNLTNFHNGKLD
jgi:general secretion pathway protein G